MLRSIKGMLKYGLEAVDGDIGRCRDFLFDDRFWVVRYMVADTGTWLPDRKVLILPADLKNADWNRMRLRVNLTKAEIKTSPPLDADAPVSRQYEKKWREHFGLPLYWTAGELWKDPRYGIKLLAGNREGDMDQEPVLEPHLRSVQEVIDYRIQAADGPIGHVEDFVVEDGWVLRYMVIDTRNWLPGRKVLVSPEWVEKVEWAGESVHVDLTCAEIRNSPPFDPAAPVNREYEMRLYDYYGRPVYWP